MRLKNHPFAPDYGPVSVRWLPGTYSGGHLYAACLVDCYDPPIFILRADTLTEAYDDDVEEVLASEYDGAEGDDVEKLLDEGMLQLTASGRAVWADEDIRVVQLTPGKIR